jgi:hypothetical protein
MRVARRARVERGELGHANAFERTISAFVVAPRTRLLGTLRKLATAPEEFSAAGPMAS